MRMPVFSLALFMIYFGTHATAQPDVQVATGNYHVMAIKDGTLYGWGDNAEGQLGIGTKSLEYAPVKIGKEKEWKQVTAAAMHTLAIKKNGSLWAWGWGNNHEMGLGQQTSRSLTPARVGNDTGWILVSTASNNTVGLQRDGSLWVWGSNVSACLGVGPTRNSAVYVPTRVGKDNDCVWAIASQHITMAIKKDGSLWSWGRKGGSDIRGLSTTDAVTTSPVQVGTDKDWKQLFIHRPHGRAAVIAQKQNGTTWAWGNNHAGKLGFGDVASRQIPEQVKLPGQWQSFAIANDYAIGIKNDGSLWHSGSYLKWTDARMGEVNSSTTFQRSKITGKWLDVHMLQNSGVVLVNDRKEIFTYGHNVRGEMGKGSKGGSWQPLQVRLD